MAGLWAISYIALWVIVLWVTLALITVLRQLGVEREQRVVSSSVPPSYEEDGPTLGARTPALVLQTDTGHGSITLSEPSTADATLVIFMSTFCEGCQLIAPEVEALYAQSSLSTRFLVVLQGNSTMCRAFVTVLSLTLPLVFDRTSEIRRAFNVHHAPYGLIYNGDGILIGKGSIDTVERLMALIQTGPSAPGTDRFRARSDSPAGRQAVGNADLL